MGELLKHLKSAARTTAGVLTWMVLHNFVLHSQNDVVNLLLDVLKAAIAGLIVMAILDLVQWKPVLHLHAESLSDPGQVVGRRLNSEWFPLTLRDGSGWFLVRIEFRCAGPLAAVLAKGFRSPGHRIELDFEPVDALTVSPEAANSVVVRQLRNGRRGVRIDLPTPTTKGMFGSFILEVRPVMNPVPLPLKASVQLVRASGGKGRRRLCFTRTSSDLKELRVEV